MRTLLTVAIMLFLLPTLAFAEGAVMKQSACSVSWDAPQTNADGSNLSDLAGYGIYVAVSPAALAALTAPSVIVDAPDPDPLASAKGIWSCKTLAPGQYYAQADAFDKTTPTNRSGRTPVLPFVSLDDVAPAAPTNLRSP